MLFFVNDVKLCHAQSYNFVVCVLIDVRLDLAKLKTLSGKFSYQKITIRVHCEIQMYFQAEAIEKSI